MKNTKKHSREICHPNCYPILIMVVFQAFKFYMEQHVENIMKTSEDRRRRRQQLEKEMMRCDV